MSSVQIKTSKKNGDTKWGNDDYKDRGFFLYPQDLFF